MSTGRQQRLICLCRCTGRSESLLGAHAILKRESPDKQVYPCSHEFFITCTYNNNLKFYIAPDIALFIPPANFVCGGRVYCFHVRPSVRVSARDAGFS